MGKNKLIGVCLFLLLITGASEAYLYTAPPPQYRFEEYRPPDCNNPRHRHRRRVRIDGYVETGKKQDTQVTKIKPEEPKVDLNKLIFNMRSYQEIVEKIRGKKFKSGVYGQVQSQAEFADEIKYKLEEMFYDKARYSELELMKLGLIPKDYDLQQGLEELLLSQVMAYYDPNSKTIYLVKKDYSLEQIEAFIIHELSHALQDQYYNLNVLLDQGGNQDKETAIKFLVEGEANYITNVYSLQKKTNTYTLDNPLIKDSFDKLRKMNRREIIEYLTVPSKDFREATPELLGTIAVIKYIPSYLFWMNIAPYYQGTYAIYSLVTTDGKKPDWSMVDQLYQNPPASTEQMIHISKLFNQRDNPIQIKPPALTEQWTILSQNTLGELGFWIIANEYSKEDAQRISEGWGGDKYFIIQNNWTNETLLYLSTVWDTEQDAIESFKIYNRVIRKKYPSGEMKKFENLPEGGQKITYSTSGNKLAILTLQDNKWTALEDIPAGREW